MKYVLAFIMFLALSISEPTKAIYCVYCSDCANPYTIPKNVTCDGVSGENTCMKVDFGSYVTKMCGIEAEMCSIDGFKQNLPEFYNHAKNAVGSIQVDAELVLNLNGQGRSVLNCCHNNDFCNNGMLKSLSIYVLTGMAIVYVVI